MAIAYAAFTSLMHLTTQLHDHPHPPIQLDEKQYDSLSSNICFFQRFLEDHHSTIDHESEIRIADAAHAAEDLIETHIADRVPDFYGSLQGVIERIDLVNKEVTMAEMNQNEQSQQGSYRPARYPPHDASSQLPLSASGENFVVGIEEITNDIVDKLTSSQHKSGRRIISVSGMGGIGKTTLAHKVYEHSCTKYYFDCFAWATISKDYNTHASLLEILHCLDRSKSKESLTKESEYELGIQMYQYLSGRRYLVILDDIWDFEAWDNMQSFFPACEGSGIVVTSRESKFASISSHSFRMDLLNEHKSWDLFCKHAFGQEYTCPDELRTVGKKIAKKCRGLPLSIAVIGRHLAKSPRKPEYWENIANNISSVDDDHCLKIVSLHYTHLPVHLKPCFLYFAIFSEDKKIDVSRLIRLWVAEGFVKPINGKSLEGAARDYLNDLVDRNLILAASWSSRKGRTITCKIHDLLRDFCLREASKKNFICTVQKLDDLNVTNNERRILVPLSAFKEASVTDLLSEKKELSNSSPHEPIANHQLDVSVVLKTRVHLRSFIFSGILHSIENKLVRVLVPYDKYSSVCAISHTQVPEVLHNLVNMRYIELERDNNNYRQVYILPSSISLLWNLQSLIVTDPDINEAPPEIWKMPQLRHIEFHNVILPHPPSEESNDVIMKNLQSAGLTMNFSFCEEVVKRIPNIKELKVWYNYNYKGLEEGVRTINNVDRLQKLESFECSMYWDREQSYRTLRNLTFPHSLKKLSIDRLCWDDVTNKIGSLPLLEVLVLSECTGREWKLVEGKFVKLNYLDLFRCRSLRYLTASNDHFPCLQRLRLVVLTSLEGISSEIGDVTALESIELRSCPDSAVISAKEIADEQYDLGNQELHVTVRLDKHASGLLAESLISTSNFHVHLY